MWYHRSIAEHKYKNLLWGLVFQHSRLDHHLQWWHCIWAPVHVLVASLLLQLPANGHRKATEHGPSVWENHVGNSDESPCSFPIAVVPVRVPVKALWKQWKMTPALRETRRS